MHQAYLSSLSIIAESALFLRHEKEKDWAGFWYLWRSGCTEQELRLHIVGWTGNIDPGEFIVDLYLVKWLWSGWQCLVHFKVTGPGRNVNFKKLFKFWTKIKKSTVNFLRGHWVGIGFRLSAMRWVRGVFHSVSVFHNSINIINYPSVLRVISGWSRYLSVCPHDIWDLTNKISKVFHLFVNG